ncbi:MAG: RNA-binding protein [Candidatus Omnitrophica bacterium]|nr:RNA-binding protein [Candidatus Omnitrophota bacterium]
MNIFVGNLAFAATDADLYKLFLPFGSVTSISIVREKNGTKSRGFGFLSMPDEEQAHAAITALNGKEFMGRSLNVSPSCPKTEEERERARTQKRTQPEIKPQPALKKEEDEKDSWFSPVYKEPKKRAKRRGRRTLSFLKRRAAAGITEPLKPRKKFHDNPMRWRKKRSHAKPKGGVKRDSTQHG